MWVEHFLQRARNDITLFLLLQCQILSVGTPYLLLELYMLEQLIQWESLWIQSDKHV